jgi:hypothetical protein
VGAIPATGRLAPKKSIQTRKSQHPRIGLTPELLCRVALHVCLPNPSFFFRFVIDDVNFNRRFRRTGETPVLDL